MNYFFDMDGTLTPSRSLIEKGMVEALKKLSEKHNVIVVSGSKYSQMEQQLKEAVPFVHFKLAQSGNHAIRWDSENPVEDERLWLNELEWMQKAEVYKYLLETKTAWQLELPNFGLCDWEDLLEDRGCQISFSFVGHHADIEDKKKFDPDFAKRKDFLKEYPFESNSMEVRIGGTTCFDFMQIGRNKGFFVSKLIKNQNWRKEDCVYVGDALFPGGNDETVVGVIKTMQVANTQETLEFINKELEGDNTFKQ